MHVTISGLQERQPCYGPNDYVTYIQNHQQNITDVLVCLWMSVGGQQNNCPFRATDYEQAFINAGWTIQGVASLGTMRNGAIGGGFHEPNPGNIATNELARHVRQSWGWI